MLVVEASSLRRLVQLWSNDLMFSGVLLVLLVLGGAAKGQTLTMFADPIPGLISKSADGKTIEGPAADLLRQIAVTSGLDIKLVLATAARGQLETRAKPDTCQASVVRTPEREALFRWAGPLSRARLVFFARADDPVKVDSPADAKGLSIGVLRGSAVVPWLKAQGLSFAEVADHSTSLRMLTAKRIDLWAVNEVPAAAIVKLAGGTPLRRVYTISNTFTHIACNINVPDATMERINSAMAKLTREGALAFLGLP